MIKLLTANN